jgi:hypothetical protein
MLASHITRWSIEMTHKSEAGFINVTTCRKAIMEVEETEILGCGLRNFWDFS